MHQAKDLCSVTTAMLNAEAHWRPFTMQGTSRNRPFRWTARNQPFLPRCFCQEEISANVKAGVDAFFLEDYQPDPVCEDIFADG